MKLSTAAIAAVALFGCSSFKITDNQRSTIGDKYWQDFYGDGRTSNLSHQSAVVTSQPLPSNDGSQSQTDHYDLSQEADTAFSDGVADQNIDPPESELTDGTAFGTDLSISIRNTLDKTPAASNAVDNQVAAVGADSDKVALPTNTMPRGKPNLPNVANRTESDSLQTDSVNVAHLNVNTKRNVPDNSVTLPQKQQADISNSEKTETLRKFRWPVSGKIITSFGRQLDGEQNDGINLAVPEGTPVRSAEDGTVIYAGNELKGYGNLLLIRHDDGWVSAYAHNRDLKVDRGDEVRRGDVIAHAGSTGSVNQPQLHFELRKGNKPVDPITYLPAN